MTIGERGRQRDFDLDTAINVMIIATLVRLGWGAPYASAVARGRGTHKCLLVANQIMPIPARDTLGEVMDLVDKIEASPKFVGFESEAGLPDVLANFPGGTPSVYVVVNVERLSAEVQQPYEKWVLPQFSN